MPPAVGQAYLPTAQMPFQRHTATCSKKPHFSSFSDLHSHMKNTHKHVALALIWRGAQLQSRWCLHVSTVKGATGLQQTSVVVAVVGCVGEREMRLVRRWGRERGSRAPASDCSGATPPPEWKLCGKTGDHVIHHIFCGLPLRSAPVFSCLLAPAAQRRQFKNLWYRQTVPANYFLSHAQNGAVCMLCGVVKVYYFAHDFGVYER